MITVEQLSKALAQFGASREVEFSEMGLSTYELGEVALVGEKVVLFAQLDPKENTL